MHWKGLGLLLWPLVLLVSVALFLAFKEKFKRVSPGWKWDRLLGPNASKIPESELAGVRKLRVAVIGGGLAGCTAAHVLANLGVQVTLYEREDVLGGRASTVRRVVGRWPVRIERGMDCATSGCTAIDALVAAAGLQEEAGSLNDYAYYFHRDDPRSGASVPGRSWYTIASSSTPKSPLQLSIRQRLSLAWFRICEIFSMVGWDPLDPKSMSTAKLGTLVRSSIQDVASACFDRTVSASVVEPLCRSMFQCAPDRLPGGWLHGMLAGLGMSLRWNVEGGWGKLCTKLIDVHVKPSSDEDTTSGGAGDVPTPSNHHTTLTVHTSETVTTIAECEDDASVLEVESHSNTSSERKVDRFEVVILCTPAPFTAQLLHSVTSNAVVPPTLREYVDTTRYRPCVHASFLVRTYEFSYRPKCPTLIPALLSDTYQHSALTRCAPWVKNAVAYITFPSGRLEAMVPPGSELVTVYLTDVASSELIKCLNDSVPLPTGPALSKKVSKLTKDMKARVDDATKSVRVKTGVVGSTSTNPDDIPIPTYTGRKLKIAELIWDLARFACPDVLPDVFEAVAWLECCEHGWVDMSPASNRWDQLTLVQSTQSLQVAENLPRNEPHRPVVLLAGDYVGGGTAEGAVRSSLWALDALLKGSRGHYSQTSSSRSDAGKARTSNKKRD